MHALTHQIEKPQLCFVCNKAFIRLDSLKRHLRNKHKEAYISVIEEAEEIKCLETNFSKFVV